VTIRASFTRQIETLVADLAGRDAVARDAAVARLTVIGPRAVARLLAVAESGAEGATRVAALRALEAIGDLRALDPALHVMEASDAAVATAAARVVCVFVRGPRSVSAVDGLTAAALNPSRPETVRVAAVQALRELQPSTVAPLMASLSGDANVAVRSEAGAGRDRAPRLALDQTDQRLPDDPAALRRALGREGATAPLPRLLRIVERVREREAGEPAASRAAWITVRAAAHLALAQRGSRLALYDLRESLDAAKSPLPVDMLAALSLAGDRSCLEAMAGAYARSKDPWWRDRLADTFRAIVARERITKRHAVVKRIEQRWKGVVDEIWAG